MRTRECGAHGRAVVLCLAVALSLGLPGCGGGSGTTPTPVTQPTTTTIFSATFTGLGANFAVPFDFAVGSSGSVTVVVDWTHATNNIAVYLTTPSCTIDMLNAFTCQFFAVDIGLTKPKRVDTGAFQPGSYRVWVANDGATSESGVINVLLTH